MGWADHVIWWHVFPLGFVGAEREAVSDVHHRLPQLIDWLDYLIELGANGLMLAPVFASATHGYDTLDHFRVDPRLGDENDLAALIAACHERGIAVCLDGVFNHLSADHPIVTRAVAAGPDSEAGRWIRWSGTYPYTFEGHPGLVELDLSRPAVADYVAGVMKHWLARGVDAWRLDAAYAQGAGVWAPIMEQVRAEFGQAWIFAEVIHGDYTDFVTTSGVDSLTQYELWHAIWDSLNDANFFSLEWTLRRHAQFCAGFAPQTFIGNHDVTRIATRLSDPDHLRLAVALLALLPGVPSVYAGDEQGFTGEKRDHAAGDDAIRPPFPAEPSGLLPFGRAVHDCYAELLGLRRRHPWLVRASLRVAEVTNTYIAIELTGADEHLTLELNLSHEDDHGLTGCSWRLS